jgi:hypothetical protein
MFTAFAILLPIGIYIARYKKKELGEGKKWMKLHIQCQTIAAGAAIASTIVRVATRSSDASPNPHRILGYITLVAMLLIPKTIHGVMAPPDGHAGPGAGKPSESAVNMHRWNGVAVLALGYASIILGLWYIDGTLRKVVAALTALSIGGLVLLVWHTERAMHSADVLARALSLA